MTGEQEDVNVSFEIKSLLRLGVFFLRSKWVQEDVGPILKALD